MRRKTSPLASLVGSHQPRPAWLTMRISPLPRRYFRLSFVLSFRSSFQHGGVRSSTRAQRTSRAIPRFRGHAGSYSLLAFERRSWAVWPWACFRPCPAPKPRDRRAARARGTRGSLRRTLVARPTLAVSVPTPSLLARRWAKAARTENPAEKQHDWRDEITLITVRIPLCNELGPFPRYHGRCASDRNSPSVLV